MTGPQPTEPPVSSQMETILRSLKGIRRVGPRKWVAFCPAHPDRREPSLSLRVGRDQPVLVYCFAGCTFKEIFAALRKRRPGNASLSRVLGKSSDDSRPPDPLPGWASVYGWNERLKGDLEARQYLEQRGINLDTLIEHAIGWNGRSYTLPVFGEHRLLDNLRTYDRNGSPKMRGLFGRGSQLYPPDVLGSDAEHVVLCEGEWDALLLNQHGIPAVAGTAGATTFKEEWAEQFKGRSVWVAYDCDEAGRKGARKAAGVLTKHAKAVHIVDLDLPDKGADVTDWFARYGRSSEDFLKLLEDPAETVKNPDDGESSDDYGFILGSDVRVRPVPWLWKGYIPRRKISILEGNPGRLKTTIAMDLIARVTKGKPMPGTKGRTEPGSVLVLCAEDDEDDTLVPRLMAVGADLSQLAFYKVDRDEDGQVVPLAIPDDLQELERRIKRLAKVTGVPVQLVVIDPITAYLGERINSHNDASVRKALYPLADLASRTEVAVLLVRHLNKDGSLQAEFRGGGSIAFTGASRSVLVVEKHPEEPNRYVLARVKNNLHAPVQSVVYEGVANTTYDAPAIRWISHSELDADSLLRGPDGRSAAPARKNAEAFLNEVLSDGPMKVPELEVLAKRAGISWRTVQRAKDDLKIVVRAVRDEAGQKFDHWEWSLPYPTTPQTAKDGSGGN